MMPAGSAPGPILDWESAERIPWGILLLFGGGLSLAEGVDSTGLAQWIGNQVSTLHTLPYFVFVLCIVGTITFLTGFTSNTAIAAVFAPIVAGICASQGLEPFGMLFAVAVAAAFAFMLPVATPPNAIVFAQASSRCATWPASAS
jgi:sodium-dependent dicarboxylate transporter 2/3/5